MVIEPCGKAIVRGAANGEAASELIVTEEFIAADYRRRIEADYAGFVAELKGDLDAGLAIMENFLAPGFLVELQASIAPLIAQCYAGGERRPLTGGDLSGTLFDEVTNAAFLRRLANDLLADFQVHLEREDIYPVLNILAGEQGQSAVHDWHFDATYLTIAMPVIVPPPETPRDGKLRIWPNVRRFSQNLTLNRIYWNAAKSPMVRRAVRNFAVHLIPGNLYCFYGFRCFHGIEELDPNHLRAVCLMNFGGPLFDREKGKRLRYDRAVNKGQATGSPAGLDKTSHVVSQ